MPPNCASERSSRCGWRSTPVQHCILLHEDSLDHTFLAAANLGVAHDPELAALALGAEAEFRSTHQVLPDVLRDANTARLVVQVRGILNDDDFESAWQRGSNMTVMDILDMTLERFGRSRT